MSSSKHTPQTSNTECSARITRRAAFGLVAGFGASSAFVVEAQAQAASDMMPGDQLVHLRGEKPITPEDVTADSDKTILAYPQDPATGKTRKGSKNKIALVRIDPASVGAESSERHVDGLVAYSAVCTHAGCEIKQFQPDTGLMRCQCHGSEFDPANNGAVIKGPAKFQLSSLAIEVRDGGIFVVEPLDPEAVGAQ